jgi:hypothetical protein
MKKYIFTFLLLTIGLNLKAQVYAGNAEIEGIKKDGFYVYVKGQEDQIFTSWKNYVKDFGAIDKSKNLVLLAKNLKIPSSETKGILLTSKVIIEGEKTKLFVALEGQNKEVIKSGHTDYRTASNWLEEFTTKFSLEEGYRLEQEKLEELIRNRTKIEKTGERLVRELEANTRQTDMLNKRLEETKINKEKILTNQEQQKLDIQKIEAEVIQQRKNVETAKQKIK